MATASSQRSAAHNGHPLAGLRDATGDSRPAPGTADAPLVLAAAPGILSLRAYRSASYVAMYAVTSSSSSPRVCR